MSDAWLGDVGIQVTDMARSLDFCTKLLDLEQIDGAGDDYSRYVLLRDRRSGQRLELNGYAEGSPFAAPYVSGEALDHFEVRVKSLPDIRKRLKSMGIQPATKKFWANRKAIQTLKTDPEAKNVMDRDMWVTRKGHRIVYIQDPDGIFLCLHDHPEEEWGGPVPDHC